MDTRTLTIVFQAGPIASTDVSALRIDRRLGKIAEAQVHVRSTTYAEPDDLLGAPARIAVGRDGEDEEVLGVVTSVGMVTSPENDARDYLVYHLEVCSCLALLERQVDCRIFQDKDVKEIVSEVLKGFGIADG